LPAFLRYKPEMEDTLEADQSTALLLSIHLDFLYNDFLLQRILVKRTETRSEALIAISREILNIVLVFVSKSNRSMRANCDLGWNVRGPCTHY
jgi:chromatin structure-remodeling complex subunit RSC3/30